MIVSVSRRTDIPAFYSRWFLNRVRAGFCLVPNPFNPQQTTRISLEPAEVAAMVFWTRHPRPLFPHLPELDRLGHRYYFLYSLLGYPRALEPRRPSLAAALRTFAELAGRVGPERVVWRYDPIVFCRGLSPHDHLERFGRLAKALEGATRRCVISFVQDYRKTQKRMAEAARAGCVPLTPDQAARRGLIEGMNRIAAERGMILTGCAQSQAVADLGLAPGKCVDDDLLRRVFGVEVVGGKDAGQRGACRCAPSRDVGMYDSCLFGCAYCYATGDFDRARRKYLAHDPESPSLLG